MFNVTKSSEDVIFLSKFIKKSHVVRYIMPPDKECMIDNSEVKHETKDVREYDSTNCQRVF